MIRETKFIASSPHFFVSDYNRSLDFYVNTLGFECPQVWGDPPSFAIPSRDGLAVMLNFEEDCSPNPNGNIGGWDAYFWCEGLEEYRDRVIALTRLEHDIVERDLYGNIEFALKDPDGYLLVFAENITG